MTVAACLCVPTIPVYEGMIVGIHSRDNDLVVNATRTKQLTNFRVSGKEDAIKITPPIELTLEYGVEFIEDDELVEITPKSVRLRKRHLTESERKEGRSRVVVKVFVVVASDEVCWRRFGGRWGVSP
jgi:predicted membrane GTPase involved in stress response